MAKDIKFNIKVEGADKATQEVANLDKQVEKTSGSLDNMNNQAGKTTGLMGAFSGSLGGLKGSLGGVDAATGGFGKTLMGLLANPIVAIIGGIVAAFMLLKKALQSSEEGQQKMAKITTMLSTIFSRLMDVLEPLASFIADYIIVQIEIMTAVFTKAAEVVAGAMRFFGFGEAADGLEEYMKKTEEAAALAAKVADERAAADLLDRENIVARAEADKMAAEAKEKMFDKENFSLEERKAAIEEAAKAQDEISKREEIATKKRLDALKLEASLSNSNKETLDEIAKLEASLINIGTERAQAATALQKQLNKVSKEEIKDEEEKTKKNQEENKKRIDAAKKAYDEMLKKVGENLAAELLVLEDGNKALRLKELEKYNSGIIDIETFQLNVKEIEEKAVLDRIAILENENIEIEKNRKIKQADREKIIAANERAITDLQIKAATDRQNKLLSDEKKAEETKKKEVLEVAAKERLDLIIKFNDGEIKTQEDFDKKMAELEMKNMRDRLKTLKEGSEEYLNLQAEILQKEKDMRDASNQKAKEASDAAVEADKAAYEARLNKLNEVMGVITQISDIALGVINEISQRSFDEEMERINVKTETGIQELDRQKAAGLITEDKYNKELEKLNKKKAIEEDKVKRAKFNQDKAIKAIETIINTAAGVAAAIPNIPLMVIAGLAGAAQLGLILSQQYPSPGSAAGGGGGGGGASTITAPPEEPAPFIQTSLPEFSGMEGAGPGGALIGGGGENIITTRVEVVLVESEFSAVQNRVKVLEDRSLIQ